jgi:hypothetical protein
MQQAIDIIRDSKILTKEDIKSISHLKDELLDNFHTTQIFRTRVEMDVCVLNDVKHPTPDSKYWQCQREQKVHFHELVMLSYEYRKNIVEIKKLERKLQTEEDDLERELLIIEIEKQKFIACNQERVAKDRIREIQAWHEIKAELKPHLKHGTKDVNEHQLVSYNMRFHNQAQSLPKMSGPEANNLIGQLVTSDRVLKQGNLLEAKCQ